jgi:hypothetical protein
VEHHDGRALGSLLRRLVLRETLSREERASLGGARIPAGALAGLIEAELAGVPFFPPQARPWKSGEPCMEGFFIEGLPGGRYRVHCQRHHTLDPFTMAEGYCDDYAGSRAAVMAYLHEQHGKAIDGIGIDYPLRWLPLRIFLAVRIRLKGPGKRRRPG